MFSFVVFSFQRGNISHFHTWGRSHSTRVWLLCRIYCHGLIFFFRVFLRTLWAFSSLIHKIWADDMLSEFLLSIITRKQKITSCRSVFKYFWGKKSFNQQKFKGVIRSYGFLFHLCQVPRQRHFPYQWILQEQVPNNLSMQHLKAWSSSLIISEMLLKTLIMNLTRSFAQVSQHQRSLPDNVVLAFKLPYESSFVNKLFGSAEQEKLKYINKVKLLQT